jgi:flagellin FlaB
MLDKYTNKSKDRGQVGIGTLIVFIALVLVAAIAAGVLINVAGLLQEQGENTGEESVEEVSNQVVVTSTYAETNGDGNVTQVNFHVRKASGSDDIDLSKGSLEYLGPNGQKTMTYTNSGADSDFAAYGVSSNLDENTSSPVLTQTSDRFVIEMSLDDSDTDPAVPTALSSRNEFSVDLVTESGSSITKTYQVPKQLDSDSVTKLE